MTTPHPYRLHAYHNPVNLDESQVPQGWRFRYEYEMTKKAQVAKFGDGAGWYSSIEYGQNMEITYIVPVAP